ncbi:MAG: FAD binding domain-containing protein, partial [Planctomycetaceae bacterium]|nr:FAD binding domain-containing protein [Planctomycetaceae bacterium]
MHDFDFQAPATLTDALALLAEQNGNARPLAGGTDLIDHVRMGRLKPNVVVDLKKLDELNVLSVDADGLRLGAAVPCYKIYSHPEIVKNYSALADSCHIIGGIQIQSRA